jgi:hypothetical protein
MDDITKVLIGAFAGFLAAVVGEHLKRVHASRIAAAMLMRELAFHKMRLSLAVSFDQGPKASYLLKFPSAVWDAQAAALLAGASLRKSVPILNWYASMAVLGFSIGKQVDESGSTQMTGPDRSSLSAALTDAYGASVALSQRWSFRRRMTIALPLFDNVVLKGGEAESGGRRRK